MLSVPVHLIVDKKQLDSAEAKAFSCIWQKSVAKVGWLPGCVGYIPTRMLWIFFLLNTFQLFFEEMYSEFPIMHFAKLTVSILCDLFLMIWGRVFLCNSIDCSDFISICPHQRSQNQDLTFIHWWLKGRWSWKGINITEENKRIKIPALLLSY